VLKKKCSKGKNVGIETKQQIENTKKLQQINIVYWILVAVMLILVGYVYVIPLLLDIPYVVSNDYYSVEGEIIEKGERRIGAKITIKDKEDIIKVSVLGSDMEVGDYVKVLYLPHSKDGTIVECGE